MKSRVFFVTGTNTSVGKTVLSSLLTRHLLATGVNIKAVKPLCAGGRDDGVALRAAQANVPSLNAVNPWCFQSSITPLLAARRKGKRIRLPEVLRFLQEARESCEVLLVEGAGGLLSPLGPGFSSRELIEQMHATPIVVCPNRLGAINQVLLVLEALPSDAARRAHVVLMARPHADSSARTNATMIRELARTKNVHEFPWLGSVLNPAAVKLSGTVGRALKRITNSL